MCHRRIDIQAYPYDFEKRFGGDFQELCNESTTQKRRSRRKIGENLRLSVVDSLDSIACIRSLRNQEMRVPSDSPDFKTRASEFSCAAPTTVMFLTPASSASRQARSFGRIPPVA